MPDRRAAPTATDPPKAADPRPLSGRGRTWRLTVAATLAIVLLAGTFWGDDPDFPFGPFRMYATRDDPNGVVRILAVQLVEPDDTVVDVTDTAGAPRRAELEGRVDELRTDASILRSLAPNYVGQDDAAVQLRVVWQVHRLVGGRAQPPTVDVIASLPIGPDGP